MKKFNILLLTAAVLLCSCVTANKVNYDESMGTPENSVLVYGYCTGINHIIFEEVPKDNGSISGNPTIIDLESIPGNVFLCPVPVKMETHFKVTFVKDIPQQHYLGPQTMASVSFHESYKEGTEEAKSFEFTAPKKPGLYYYGTRRLPKYGTLSASDEKKAQQMAIKQAIKIYAGTIWEPLLQAELESVK